MAVSGRNLIHIDNYIAGHRYFPNFWHNSCLTSGNRSAWRKTPEGPQPLTLRPAPSSLYSAGLSISTGFRFSAWTPAAVTATPPGTIKGPAEAGPGVEDRSTGIKATVELPFPFVGFWGRSPVPIELQWKERGCGETSSRLPILIARSRRTFPSGSFVSLTLS